MRLLFTSFLALLTINCAPQVAAQELAPSCSDVFSTYGYDGKAEGQTLLVVLNGKLADVFEVSVPPRNEDYEFYYIFQNKDCSAEAPCVEKRILEIKNIKITKFSARNFVYLSREGDVVDRPIDKSAYDEFHNADETAPADELNYFHITYRDRQSRKLHTHYPKDRRRTYIFADLPQGKTPWLKARNYQFRPNSSGAPQCIRFTMQLQRNTESAAIDIVEIEDGSGATPRKIQQWNLKIKQ